MPFASNISSIASARPLFQTSSNQRRTNSLFSSDMRFSPMCSVCRAETAYARFLCHYNTDPLISKEMQTLQRLRADLFKPVDISFLVFFRVLFGAIMLWEVYRYATYGWISRYFVEPALTFTYYGFSWVKPWPGSGMYIHFWVLGVTAAFIMAGFFY